MPLFGIRDMIADTLGLSSEAEKRTRKKPLIERIFELPTVGNGRLDPGGGMETNRGERSEDGND